MADGTKLLKMVEITPMAFNLLAGSTGGAPPVTSTPDSGFFTDSFESGDLTATGGGFSWGDTNYGEAPGDLVQVNTDQAKTGSYALMFRNGGTAGGDSWAEQRFELGADYTEIYFKYDLYYPSNYEHRSGNNKFFELWSGSRDTNGIWVTFNVWDDPSRSNAVDGILSTTMEGNTSPVNTSAHHRYDTDLEPQITPSLLGQWNRFVIRMKVGTTAGNDGIFQCWINGSLAYDRQDLPMYSSVSNDFSAGYIWGWANSGYAVTTDVFVDDVVVSTSVIDP